MLVSMIRWRNVGRRTFVGSCLICGLILVLSSRCWVVQLQGYPSGSSVGKVTSVVPRKTLPIAAGNLTNSLPLLPLPPPPPSTNGQSTRSHSAIYVHVGKTGGITLDKVLHSNCMWYEGQARRRKCLRTLTNGSQVSEITKATLHFGPRKDYIEWMDHASLFLITLRNPIARAVSAFDFDHPSNQLPSRYGGQSMPPDVKQFYIECFPTIQDMTDLLELADQRGREKFSKKQKRCLDTAKRTLAGQGSTIAASHLRMNYFYYHRLSTAMRPNRPVLVLRTEQLWDDLSRVDRMLGGAGVFDSAGMIYTHGSQYHAVRGSLSATGIQVLCCYLVPELQLYEELLRRAVNLHESEKEETMRRLYHDCGVDRSANEQGSFAWDEWAQAACLAYKALPLMMNRGTL